MNSVANAGYQRVGYEICNRTCEDFYRFKIGCIRTAICSFYAYAKCACGIISVCYRIHIRISRSHVSITKSPHERCSTGGVIYEPNRMRIATTYFTSIYGYIQANRIGRNHNRKSLRVAATPVGTDEAWIKCILYAAVVSVVYLQ